MKSGPVILIDMMNLVFRQHFTHSGLMHDGKHTGVQYGVLRTINNLRNSVSPRMIFVWDHGVPVLGAQRPRNWREEFLSAYKANRKRNPEVHEIVVSQLTDLHHAICCLGYSHASVMGLEADDMIGLLSNEYPEVYIFSTDKDFYQLLCDHVYVLVPKKDKGQFRKIFKSDVEREYDIPVSRFAEYLALGGDGCDNIKPLKGMGPKTALKLIKSGVDLTVSLEHQPIEFKEKYAHVWDAIQKSFTAARIPTSWEDPRINNCIPKALRNRTQALCYRPSPDQTEKDDLGVKGFEKFLADRNMVSLLSIRRSFFDAPNSTQRSQIQCQPTSKQNPARLSNRTLI